MYKWITYKPVYIIITIIAAHIAIYMIYINIFLPPLFAHTSYKVHLAAS